MHDNIGTYMACSLLCKYRTKNSIGIACKKCRELLFLVQFSGEILNSRWHPLSSPLKSAIYQHITARDSITYTFYFSHLLALSLEKAHFQSVL